MIGTMHGSYFGDIRYQADRASIGFLFSSVARLVFEAVETDRVGHFVGMECRVIDIVERRLWDYDIIYRGLATGTVERTSIYRNLLHRPVHVRHVAAAHYPRHRIFRAIGVYPLGDMQTCTVATALDAVEHLAGVKSYGLGKTVNRHSRFANNCLDTFPTGIFHNDKKERTQCKPLYLWTVGETFNSFQVTLRPSRTVQIQ